MTEKKAEQHRSILLVDDDAEGLAALAEGLTRAGYRVTTAESGDVALRCAKSHVFDLAVVDMRMPDMTGAELAGHLLKNFGCFSLILSGSSDPGFVRDAVRDGALGYLTKPLDAPRLVPAIETALARAREVSGLMRSHENLSTTLREGRETSMAIGVLVERLRLDRDSAFARLRDTARNQRRRVAEVAEQVVIAAEILNGGDAAQARR
jgi:two-component system, response regulator PdtaR